ncbi:30S ribosomal protein S1 [Vallitalea pronyensis]|uniref:30S ribosomal protein S1 n=1 Tax=Vallitalea pronyensis TaxID=1348613 RepID=A0A8J8MK10_9FIRM|nr:30S ribosomal protein S1 [Vallitalea pronyensis]QUI23100.1 30S ribosomal protein S1 [Vallitalea pronyensis]
MSEVQSFEEMLEESLKSIHRGEIVEGTVIDVNDSEVYVNIGYKSDGIIPKSEYSNYPEINLKEAVKAGDKLQVKVLRVNDGEGQVLLTYKRILAEQGIRKVEEYYKNKDEITAKVSLVLAGGLVVIVEEVRIFIPASLVSDEYVENLNDFKGKELTFVITEFNMKKGRIIGNRKQLLLAEKQTKLKETMGKLEVGKVVSGQIKNVTDYGAFVNIEGVDGLIHISQMSWGRVKKPSDVVKVGQEVKVRIIGIDENKNKVSLSMKFDEENPWNDAATKYAVGNVVDGTVARMTDFGAFIELEPGVDALLHVSQISKKHVEKPSDALKIGEKITSKVLDFNEEAKKISLSIKALEEEKEEVKEEVKEEPAVVEMKEEPVAAEVVEEESVVEEVQE